MSSTRFYGGTFARSWLSVAIASSSDKDRPAMHHTVLLELFPEGVRLVATDSYVLLTSWAPCIDHENDPEPELDVEPVRTAVAMDVHGRARGFLGHMLKLAASHAADSNTDEDPPEVRLELGVKAKRGAMSFAGMEAQWVVLEHQGHERLRLLAYEGEFPSWRNLYKHVPPAKKTSTIALNPELLARLCKLGRYHQGRPLVWGFHGPLASARVRVDEAFPRVDGLVMPIRTPETDAAAEDDRKHARDLAGVDATFGPSDEVEDRKEPQVTAVDLRPEAKPRARRSRAKPQVTAARDLDDSGDELLDQAAHLVVSSQLGSTSMLARKLRITIVRAERIMDRLEDRHIVGTRAVSGNGVRTVLVDADGQPHGKSR